jgi:hypothetical protein
MKEKDVIEVADAAGIEVYDVIRDGDETMWVERIDGRRLTVVRDFPWIDGTPYGDARPVEVIARG